MIIKKENNNKDSIRVGSLFAAIGGFSSAFKSLGADIMWANEIDPYASTTYRLNNPDVRQIEKSVQDLSVKGDLLEEVDILTAGFPCQPFSVAGSKLGFEDVRGLLFLDIIRIIKEFGQKKPKVLLLENVKNLKTHDKGKTFKRIQMEIQNAGYWFPETNAKILNTCRHTEIPQNRERIFMVAFCQEHFLSSNFIFPEEIETKKKNSVFNFINTKKKPDQDNIYFKETSQYYPLFDEAIKAGGTSSVYQLRRVYVRQNKSETCFTLTASMGIGGHNVPVVRDSWGIRKLTIRECARLQGYEDSWFKIPENMPHRQLYKQLGNSVTVPLVARIAEKILEKLKQRSNQ
jgi:DNA (cytosine-5)-methyltransferase 1